MSSLQNCISNWRHLLGVDNKVTQWISEGIKIPFSHEPASFFLQNHVLTASQERFVNEKVDELLVKKFISEVNYVPLCVSPIGCVSKKGGKLRLITDLRVVNSYSVTPKFRYEDISVLPQVVQKGDKLVTIDLKDGFFHVPVHPDFRKYLGFCWNNQFYVWNVLPFGLQSSPYFFCKVLRPVIEHLRTLNIRLIAYVDDILICARDADITTQRDLVLETLQTLGFHINEEKSSLIPENTKQFLGYLVVTGDDSVTLKVPKSRIKKVRADIRRALAKPTIRARTLARVIGQCVATTKAVLPGKLKLREAYRLLRSKTSWDSILVWSETARSDFEWWITALEQWNGSTLLPTSIDAQLVTDASKVGWGALLDDKEAQGFWDKSIGHSHSNVREMWAVYMALVSFREDLTGKTIQIRSDNITTVAYLNKMGGSSLELNKIATDIWAEAINNRVSISCCHIAGKDNTGADSLSRLNDKFEWMLHPALFQLLDNMWGPHTIDRFASALTTQLDNFNSRFYNPLASGIDALVQQDWASHNNYVNPPFRLIPQVLEVIRNQGANATIIAPAWKAQPWYRKLVKASTNPPFRIKNVQKSVISTWGNAEPLLNNRWKLYAWRVCGNNL